MGWGGGGGEVGGFEVGGFEGGFEGGLGECWGGGEVGRWGGRVGAGGGGRRERGWGRWGRTHLLGWPYFDTLSEASKEAHRLKESTPGGRVGFRNLCAIACRRRAWQT